MIRKLLLMTSFFVPFYLRAQLDIQPNNNWPLCFGDNIVLNYTTSLPSCYTYSARITNSSYGFTQNYPCSNGNCLVTIPTSIKQGVYQVVIIGDRSGCPNKPPHPTVYSNQTISIPFYAPPTVEITPNAAISYCEDQKVTLVASSNNAATYEWLDNSGITKGYGQNYSPDKSGSYYAKVKSPEDCYGESQKVNVIVDPVVEPYFTTNKSSYCEKDEKVTLTNHTATNAEILVDWGNGVTTKTLDYTYDKPGDYVITMLATVNGKCSRQYPQKVTINPKPANPISIIGESEVCDRDTTKIEAVKAPFTTTYQYEWYLDGQLVQGLFNRVIRADKTGTYNYKVTDFSTKCTNTSPMVSVSVLQSPEFTVATNAKENCPYIPTTVTVTPKVNSTDFSTQVVYGDGSNNFSNKKVSVYQYQNSGDYTIQATMYNKNKCPVTKTTPIRILEQPKADMEVAPTTCFSKSVVFTDKSVADVSVINYRLWFFGDNLNSPLATPNHLYAKAGNYNTSLVVGNTVGCFDTIQKVISIQENPLAIIDAPQVVCQNSPIYLKNKSTSALPFSSYWTFSEQLQPSNEFEPTIYFQTKGLKTIKLTVKTLDPSECHDDTTVSVFVNAKPSVNFDVPGRCGRLPTELKNQSVDPDGTNAVLKCNWVIDENKKFPATANQTYIFNEGLNTAKLIVQNLTTGCADSLEKQIYMDYRPKNMLEYDRKGPDMEITFMNKASIASGSIQKHEFWFGDGQSKITTSNSETHTYTGTHSSHPNYLAKVTSTSFSGCQGDTASVTLQAYPLLVTQIKHSPGCDSTAVFFTDTTLSVHPKTGEKSEILKYEWNFGDGLTAFTKDYFHTYPNIGTYQVVLKVTNDVGRTDADTIVIKISKPVKSRFDISDTAFCVNNSPGKITLTNRAEKASSTFIIPDAFGSFGNSNNTISISNLAEVNLKQLPIGTYPIEQKTVDQNGCRDSSVQIVRVFRPVERRFFEITPTYTKDMVYLEVGTNGDIVDNETVILDFSNKKETKPTTAKNHPTQRFTRFEIQRPDSVNITYKISITASRKGNCLNTSKDSTGIISHKPIIKVDFEQEGESGKVTISNKSINDIKDSTRWKICETIKESCEGLPKDLISHDSLKSAIEYRLLSNSDKMSSKLKVSITVYDAFTDKTYLIDSTFSFNIKPFKRILLPTVFSPNGDGFNDSLNVVAVNSAIQSFEMKVFDKERHLLFITNDISIGWSGKASNGERLPSDFYYVVVWAQFRDCQTTIIDDWVLLKY